MIKKMDRNCLIEAADRYQQENEFEKARELYQKINELFPGDFDLIARELHCSIGICHWQRYEYLQRTLRDNFRHKGGFLIGEAILASPFFDAQDLLEISRRRASHFTQLISQSKPHVRKDRNALRKRKLRIGFLGADFYNQATTHLMVGLIEERNREEFEYIAYDYGPAPDDKMRHRITSAFDRLRRVPDSDNEKIAELIRTDEIDVLLYIRDPGDPRYGVLARRPAPVQLAYLYNPSGYGAPLVDFLVADEITVPPELEHNYSEKIVRLPFSYQPNDAKRATPQRCSRKEFNLPSDKVVLANLGSSFKITPTMFDVWCEILRRYPQCVLWLLEQRVGIASNLRLEASLRGIDPSRIIFSPVQSTTRHISRLSCADFMLDTYPYGGHTGSSDALWAGLPVLTLMGETFASRVAASLLGAVGLSCLVARTQQEYVDIASRLIDDTSALAAHRTHLVTRRRSLPLFDIRAYTRHFEAMLARVSTAPGSGSGSG